MDKPNILLLTIDALRVDMLKSYGGSGANTPNLDRFAQAGIRFEYAITGGSWTQAAFPVILTSTYAGQYGGCMGKLSPARPSPIAALAECGYTTIGIATNPWLGERRGYNRGFTRFHDLAPMRKNPRLRKMRGGQTLLRLPAAHAIARLFGKRWTPAAVYVPATQINQTILADLPAAPKPWFLWAHYMDVHWPYHVQAGLTRPADLAQAWRDLAHFHRASWQNGKITPHQLAHYRELYAQALHYLDAQIGALLEQLQTRGLLENTWIFILADHGEEFLEHGQLGHLENNFHDEILRVPFMVRRPSPGAMTLTEQIRTLDLMPTILDLCHCPLPEKVEGTSLTPLWDGAPEQYRVPTAICERPRPGEETIAIRTPAFKYIWRKDAADNPGLFDLAADPAEQVNVAAAHPEVVQAFQREVDLHLERVARTNPAAPVELPLDDDKMLARLRDLGYLG